MKFNLGIETLVPKLLKILNEWRLAWSFCCSPRRVIPKPKTVESWLLKCSNIETLDDKLASAGN